MLVGWIGGQPQYYGDVWELHPIVVDERYRRRGIGRMLVRELERRLRERGVITLYLGTDDENAETSLGGMEIFPNVLDRLRELRNFRGHPFEVYQHLGFELIGVIPHAKGFGRPDILMAKRLRTSPGSDARERSPTDGRGKPTRAKTSFIPRFRGVVHPHSGSPAHVGSTAVAPQVPQTFGVSQQVPPHDMMSQECRW